MWGMGQYKGGSKMERMSEWFCANCLRMVDALSRHGRCPYCDSNAVDVAYRWSRPGASRDAQAGAMTSEFANAHN
jgi:ABC-type ATPase with predicted acetyltransferase domain